MADLETTRVVVIGATTLIEVIGGGLVVTVAFAATVPIHDPIRTTLTRLCAQGISALSVALRAFVVAYVWAVRYARRYRYRGSSRPVLRGQHRPEVVSRWQATQAYNARLPRRALRSAVWGA